MQGKTVVITGASSGIGLETARALARIEKPTKRVQNDDDARRLWALSERLCGVSW